MDTLNMETMKNGYFGQFGGRFVPPVLEVKLEQLAIEFQKAAADPTFIEEYNYYLKLWKKRYYKDDFNNSRAASEFWYWVISSYGVKENSNSIGCFVGRRKLSLNLRTSAAIRSRSSKRTQSVLAMSACPQSSINSWRSAIIASFSV